MTVPCDWPVDDGCLPTVESGDDQALEDAISVAQMVLWALSGRQYGVCEETVRPTRCGSPVDLPAPAVSIVEVRIGGEVLPATDYVLEADMLYRYGGVWPAQDVTRPAGESGTWTVTYLRGIPVPDGVGRFVATLATEFYNACTGGKCRLPRTVTELTRQGVSHRVYDPQDIYAVGKTGIPEIDLWLSAVNPHGLMQAPEVL